MKRKLEPEWLDLLPADNPAAIGSRRDLARINIIMRQPAIMARALSGLPQPRTIVDLGGGDGCFLLAVAKRLSRRAGWRGIEAVIADRQDVLGAEVRAAFAALGWNCVLWQGEVFETLASLETGTLVIANLFLHHLEDEALALLFAALTGRAAGFVACEPRRGRFALAASHLAGAIGANAVTRHDAVASVRAGFAEQELSALWPPGWTLAERRALPFTHFFMARRHAV